MDPFSILPEEVCDKIFSNLNARDIKKASLVSKHWYNIIGQSTICMKKLCIFKNFNDLNDYEGILNSNRQYQNITIIAASSKITKNTKFLRIMRNIVDKFSESLVSLKISNDLKLRSDLPKLKFLEFSCNYLSTNIFVSNGLITKAKNLEELKIGSFSLDKKSVKYIQAAIQEKGSLKILDIHDMNIIKGLNGLKLEKFRSNNFEIRHNWPIIKEFFNTQKETLQVAECPLLKTYITYFITNFPKLHTLIASPATYGYLHDDEVPEYPTNQTVTKLVLQKYFNRNEHSISHACAIISKLINLKEINFSYLTPEFIPYLYNCRSLKVVKYKSLCYFFTQEQRNEIAQHERIKFIQTQNI